jgi:hypothetical protein
MCNKIPFDTKREAKKFSTGVNKNYTKGKKRKNYKDTRRINVYKCSLCGFYHLTSMGKPQARNMLKQRNSGLSKC